MPDGALDTAVRADEVGSEEDLYDDLHSSGHHYSHPGGGGEQLAINEVGSGLRGQREGQAGATSWTPARSCRPDAHSPCSMQMLVVLAMHSAVSACSPHFGMWCQEHGLSNTGLPVPSWGPQSRCNASVLVRLMGLS